MTKFEFKPVLRAHAVKLLKNRPKWMTNKYIEDRTGIPKYWIWQVEVGETMNPTVNRLETLIAFLETHNEEEK